MHEHATRRNMFFFDGARAGALRTEGARGASRTGAPKKENVDSEDGVTHDFIRREQEPAEPKNVLGAGREPPMGTIFVSYRDYRTPAVALPVANL
jgi:hypothetical protein